MMTQYFLFVIISTIILFCSTYGATDSECANLSNTDCKTCLNTSGCAFCKNSKVCFRYELTSSPCGLTDQQFETCVGNFQVWIIIVSVIAGVLLIAILVVICCVCRKCKRRSIRKEERRQGRDDQQMEERRAAAEIRSSERTRVADQIRMKYGILKEKDNTTDYARMS